MPSAYVSKLDKRKDALAQRIIKKAEKIEQQLAELKAEIFEQGDQLWKDMQDAADVRTGEKSYTINSFDGATKITVDQKMAIRFNDNITLAKEAFFQYVDSQITEGQEDLSKLIRNAFETKRGQLDSKRIMSLFGIDIQHKKWLKAIDLLKASIVKDISKRYISVQRRNEKGDYETVGLNISSI